MQMPVLIAPLLGGGLIGVCALAVVEKLVPLMPSYALYVFLGMTLVHDGGALAGVAVATGLGSTLGALCWYLFGYALGQRRIEAAIARFGRYVFLDSARYHRVAGACRRHPFRVGLIGQVTPVVRLYVPLPAGMFRLPLPVFIAATLLGSLAWNAPLLGLGYLLRDSGRDPVAAGLAVIAGVLALELGAIAALRIRRGMRLNAASSPGVR